MEIEHSLGIRWNLNGTHISLLSYIIPLFGVVSILLWCGSSITWYCQSRLECHPSRPLHTHLGDQRTCCSWSVGRQLEHWLVWMVLLTIWRLYSEYGRRFSICLLWQCGPNGIHVGGRFWYKYRSCGRNLGGQRWGKVDIDIFLWFYWVHGNLHRARGTHLFSLWTGLVLHKKKTLNEWIHWSGFRQ